jgi:hypothetical protein
MLRVYFSPELLETLIILYQTAGRYNPHDRIVGEFVGLIHGNVLGLLVLTHYHQREVTVGSSYTSGSICCVDLHSWYGIHSHADR